MVIKQQQIKNSIIYLIPVAVGNLIPIATLSIFTRILTKEDYGILALAQVYAIFVTGIANFGLTIGYERNFFEYRTSKQDLGLLYSTLFFVITAFLICAIITYLFRSSLSKWIIGLTTQGNFLFWTFCSTGIVGLKNYYLIYFKNTENAKDFAWYTIDETILGALLALFFVWYGRIGVIGLVWGQLIASLVIFSVLSLKFLKLHPIEFNWSALRNSLMISYPLTPRIFLGVIGNQFDKYMIGLMNNVGGVGVYSIGQKISNIVFTFMTAIQNVFSPQVYSRMFDLGSRGGESIGRYLTPFAYMSVFVALLISLFAEEVITVLTPPSYHSATQIVMILSMFYATMFFGKQPQLIFVKKTYVTSLLTLLSIILNILINIPFILKWGAIGAAWGTFSAGIISGVIAFMVSQHFYEIKWEYKKMAFIFGTFFISSLLLSIMLSTGFHYGIRFLFKWVALAVYLYIGVQVEVITKDNIFLIKNMLNANGYCLSK